MENDIARYLGYKVIVNRNFSVHEFKYLDKHENNKAR